MSTLVVYYMSVSAWGNYNSSLFFFLVTASRNHCRCCSTRICAETSTMLKMGICMCFLQNIHFWKIMCLGHCDMVWEEPVMHLICFSHTLDFLVCSSISKGDACSYLNYAVYNCPIPVDVPIIVLCFTVQPWACLIVEKAVQDYFNK